MLGYIYELYNSYLVKSENFYYLSLIKEDDSSYSIHGLWPQYSDSKYPTYCRDVKFSVKELEPIIDKLNKYWYSKMEKNELFWKHEYEKHGSCMFIPITELNYFSKTIQLYEDAVKLNLIKKYLEKIPDADRILLRLDEDLNFVN